MKNFIVIIILFVKFSLFAQVGISTTSPQAALDISSTSSGLLIPRVALTSLSIAAPVINPQGGSLAISTLVFNTNTAGVAPDNVVPGYYFWNGSVWVPSSGNDWKTTGNSETFPLINFLGTTDNNDLVFRTNNTEKMRLNANGHLGIGVSNPNFKFTNSSLTNSFDGTALGLAGNNSFLWEQQDNINGYTAVFANSRIGPVSHGLLIKTADESANSIILKLMSGTTDKVTFLTNGNVGIGSIYPSRAKVEITGVLTPSSTHHLEVHADYGTEIPANTTYSGIRQFITNYPTTPLAVNNMNTYGVQSELNMSGGAEWTLGGLAFRSNNGGMTRNAGVVGHIQGQSTAADNVVAAGIFDNINGGSNQWAIYAQGKAYSTVSWTASDRSFKKQIQPIQNALNNINDLKLYSYYFDENNKHAKTLGLLACKEKQYGVIAQELEVVFPDMVTTDGFGNKLVKYDALIPIALKAIQEQQLQIETLKKQNLELFEIVKKRQ